MSHFEDPNCRPPALPPWFHGTRTQFLAVAAMLADRAELACWFDLSAGRLTPTPAVVDEMIDLIIHRALAAGTDDEGLSREGQEMDDLVDTISHLKPDWSDDPSVSSGPPR